METYTHKNRQAQLDRYFEETENEPHYSCDVCGTNATELEFEYYKNSDGTMDCPDCENGKIREVEL